MLVAPRVTLGVLGIGMAAAFVAGAMAVLALGSGQAIRPADGLGAAQERLNVQGFAESSAVSDRMGQATHRTEADLLEQSELAEARALAAAGQATHRTEADLLEQSELAEARALAATRGSGPSR